MKPNHTVSDVKATTRMTKSEASRKNGQKSPGPKTWRGRKHSSHNAFKHGLYSKELVISEADQPEFDALCTGLREQLKTDTLLHENAFDYVVVCHWRVKVAMRLEQRQFARQLQDEQHENPKDEALDEDGVIKRWYGSSFLDMRAGIRLLELAIAEFVDAGHFREETRTQLKCGFGEDYLRLLRGMDPADESIGDTVGGTSGASPRDFWIPDTLVGTSSELGETPKIMMEPRQSQHMVCKLLEQQKATLQNLRKIADANTHGRADATHNSDFNPRFLADANRELRRAVDRYLYLKKKGP